MILRRYSHLLLVLLISVAVVSCGRRKLGPDELERNQIFAEILYREDRRILGNDNFFERNLLAPEHPVVSRWCAVALARIGNPKSLPWLYLALRMPDAGVRASAAFAIGEIEDRETLNARGLDPDPDARRGLALLLDDSSSIVRMRAIEAMGKAGLPEDVPALIDCVRDTRIRAVSQQQAFLELSITALMRLGGPQALPLLRSLAADPDPQIRWRAADALTCMHDASAHTVFQQLLDSPDPDARAWARASREVGGPHGCMGLTEDMSECLVLEESALTRLTCSMLAAARLDRTVAVIETDKGNIEIELFRQDAPATTAAFIRLAHSGFYNGISFKRVVPFFLIQMGDPCDDRKGGPGYALHCEINMRSFERGSVGMALVGKDMGSSQFFVTLFPHPHFDGRYTCFGRVISGMQVADQIVPGDVIRRIRIEDDVTMLDYRQY